MRTFCVQTIGCKVNQYEGEQLAAMLKRRGLERTPDALAQSADLRVIHTCSVTTHAASTSRRQARLAGRMAAAPDAPVRLVRGVPLPQWPGDAELADATSTTDPLPLPTQTTDRARRRVIVTGCWATSDPDAAADLRGVDAVIGHHHDLAAELERLLDLWQVGAGDESQPADRATASASHDPISADDPNESGETVRHANAQTPPVAGAQRITTGRRLEVNEKMAPAGQQTAPSRVPAPTPGAASLPLLFDRQSSRQRAHLKVQDGCDAHCTYCIIPKLRTTLWSKPIDDAVAEARRLVDAGHSELVLTGIFLGAYGQSTALRRRQGTGEQPGPAPLARLVEALCTQTPGLRRLRLSSLEPGDLTDELVAVLRSFEQVAPHFHLPLQSGSDAMLRRMNRQYTRGDYLRMLDRVERAFDRPALTTDVIVAFPGEDDREFEGTIQLVERARFIHVHAFPYSPRPGTAAARWSRQFVPPLVASQRIDRLTETAAAHSLAYRRGLVGSTVHVLLERDRDPATGGIRHGRCERYFDVQFHDPLGQTGDWAAVRIGAVEPDRTIGTRVGLGSAKQ